MHLTYKNSIIAELRDNLMTQRTTNILIALLSNDETMKVADRRIAGRHFFGRIPTEDDGTDFGPRGEIYNEAEKVSYLLEWAEALLLNKIYGLWPEVFALYTREEASSDEISQAESRHCCGGN